MSEMIDKVFSTQLAGQMTGFYGKQKMLRKLNNKLEMNNQQQKVVELDDLVRSYQDKVDFSELGLYDDCEEGVDCPIMADEHVLARMEEILAEAYEAQDEQGTYDPWAGTREHLEWGEAREDSYYDGYEQDELRRQLEDDLAYKERELVLAKKTAERERQRRERAEAGTNTSHEAPKRQAQVNPTGHIPQPEVTKTPYAHHHEADQTVHTVPQPIMHHSQQPKAGLNPGQNAYNPLHHQEYAPVEHVYPVVHHHTPQPEIFHQEQVPQHQGMATQTYQHQMTPAPVQQHYLPSEAPSYSMPHNPRDGEILAAMRAEELAASQARKWEADKLLQQEHARSVMAQQQMQQQAEREAHDQALRWKQHEEEMAQAADFSRFEQYQESLRSKDWDELRLERELRRARERSMFNRGESSTLPMPNNNNSQHQQQHITTSTHRPNWESISQANSPLPPVAHQASPLSNGNENSMMAPQQQQLRRSDSVTDNDQYGHWTDPPFLPSTPMPSHSQFRATDHLMKPRKKGALRWLDPDWSIVRWAKHLFSDEDEYDVHDQYHHHSVNQNSLDDNEFIQQGITSGEMPQSVTQQSKQSAHAIIISSIFSGLVTLFGLYLCMQVMLPKNRFERNTNLTVFYLAAFSYLIISLLPVSNDDSEVVYHFHRHWNHHPASVIGVCTEIFRLAVILFHLSSLTNLFLLTLNRKFREMEKVQIWATFLREFNIVATFVCLAFIIPLRQDFDWVLSSVLVYILAAIIFLAMQPDSKLEIVLNLVVLTLAYLQFTTLFILAVFILNFKVFKHGFRKTKYVKTSAEHSIAWAKSEFMDATSYLNSSLECTTDGDSFVNERATKREIISYGIISIVEEKVEYVGGSSDASFILFDASNTERSTGIGNILPAIEKSELSVIEKRVSKPSNRDAHSDRTNPRGRSSRGQQSSDRARSKSPTATYNNANSNQQRLTNFNSTQPMAPHPLGANHTFSSNASSSQPSVGVNMTGVRKKEQVAQPDNDQMLQREYEPPRMTQQRQSLAAQPQSMASQVTFAQQARDLIQDDTNMADFSQPRRSNPHHQDQLAPQSASTFFRREPTPPHSTNTSYLTATGQQQRASTNGGETEDELFYDCAGGRSTPNLGNDLSHDTSGILLQMPASPTRGSAQGFRQQQHTLQSHSPLRH